MPGRTVAELADLVSGRVVGDSTRIVTDVTHDSRSAGPGVLFVAVEGAAHDGHLYVAEAVDAGTPVICVARQMSTPATQIVVDSPRFAMGPLAAAVHDDPSRHIPVIGVTGTDGKTTVTHFIESIAFGAGLTPGLIGTIRTSVGGRVIESSKRTTPEATDFQRTLARMRAEGADVIASEISSHALDLGRVKGTSFAVAAFTNLSHDHLDFHHDLDSYRATKERLFREYPVEVAVVNIDDPAGRSIREWATMPVVTVGEGGRYQASKLTYTHQSTSFDLRIGDRTKRVTAPILGGFNVSNLLVAAACCGSIGIEEEQIVTSLSEVPGVPGRFELVSGDSPVAVAVDYAHTPHGITSAIKSGRQIGGGALIVVLGAGGDRDVEKRPLMGTAASGADLVIITNDNPRSEDPEVIASAVAAGLPEGKVPIIELDRRLAIRRALDEAAPGDMILVLGKGHETGQEEAGVSVPFSDRETVRELLGLDTRSAESGRTSGSMST